MSMFSAGNTSVGPSIMDRVAPMPSMVVMVSISSGIFDNWYVFCSDEPLWFQFRTYVVPNHYWFWFSLETIILVTFYGWNLKNQFGSCFELHWKWFWKKKHLNLTTKLKIAFRKSKSVNRTKHSLFQSGFVLFGFVYLEFWTGSGQMSKVCVHDDNLFSWDALVEWWQSKSNRHETQNWRWCYGKI